MAKRKQNFEDYSKSFRKPQLNLKKDTRRGVIGVIFLVLAALLGLSLLELAGPFGKISHQIMKLAFGWMAYGVPVVFVLISFALFRQNEAEESNTISTHAYVGGVLLIVTLTGILHLWVIRNDIAGAFEIVKAGMGGGYLGVLTSYPLIHLFGFVASMVVMVACFIIAFLVTFNVSFKDLFGWLFGKKVEQKPQIPKAREFGEVKINNPQAAGFVKENLQDFNKVIKEEKLQTVINGIPDIRPSKKPPIMNQADKNWKFPPLDLLDDSKTKVDSGNIEVNLAIIQKTLADFGIEVEMGEVNVGPTVTQYTLRPAVGVKLSQIAALQSDLALALAAQSIRLELPIPGKALVGIEIPNKTTATVRIREIIEHQSFVEHPSKLAFVLGRDVAGHPIVSDLAKMPHMLIAGSTGTGKSVCINAVLTSFLYRNNPSELKLLVIDPKRVELSLYNGLPHLLTPVITDHQKAVNALKWAVAEMEKRYKLLSEVKKRNISEYNQASLVKMPYIVVVIDELAELMIVAQNEVEHAIVRIAQLARAVGIHLVVATQRPSVDVITGLIKANITARIAFAVAQQVDSRTIIDMAGAEKLLGMGDMLYVTAEMSKPKRVQGAFVGEKEIKGITKFIKDEVGDVIYDESILEKPQREFSIPGLDSDDGDDDELLEEAVEIVRSTGKASTTFLQRRLRIGYARAARLMDLMEEQGVISPGEGAKRREVYGAKSGGGADEVSDDEANEFEQQQKGDY
jgi:S-DNA-T family DNA segregation ATPase FtsK/SpoIIIE